MFHIHTAKQMDNNVTALNSNMIRYAKMFHYFLVFLGVFFFLNFLF